MMVKMSPPARVVVSMPRLSIRRPTCCGSRWSSSRPRAPAGAPALTGRAFGEDPVAALGAAFLELTVEGLRRHGVETEMAPSD